MRMRRVGHTAYNVPMPRTFQPVFPRIGNGAEHIGALGEHALPSEPSVVPPAIAGGKKVPRSGRDF